MRKGFQEESSDVIVGEDRRSKEELRKYQLSFLIKGERLGGRVGVVL